MVAVPKVRGIHRFRLERLISGKLGSRASRCRWSSLSAPLVWVEAPQFIVRAHLAYANLPTAHETAAWCKLAWHRSQITIGGTRCNALARSCVTSRTRIPLPDRMEYPATVHDVNVLTVVASVSYKDSVSALQKDLSESLSARPQFANVEFFAGMALQPAAGVVQVGQ